MIVCVSFGVAETKDDLPLKLIVIHYYGIHSRANICCTTTKCGLILSHHTDFLF